MTQRLVVGVDGSAGSRAAIEWAIAEAQLRGAELEVTAAWEFPYAWGEAAAWAPGGDGGLAEAAGAEATALLDQILDGPQPDWLHVLTVEGPPARVLVERSADADLLVVGSRGRGGFATLLLGSVSMACVQHARCPVTVVPSRLTETTETKE
ncbi:universal stress protein [Nakamurella lactea]|uniref:universal stress protein n=1 Tax=Nakamurella lactea TaxID=459515 RepID=UPI000562DE08|nr:universal stress protein [Nakamurella lactea]